MAWPDWIEELKDRYLADEASVFLLYGNITGTTWSIDGEELDCVGVLVKFLSRSRPVVGVLHPWPHPSRLEFAGIADRTRFENLVKAFELVEGRTDALSEADPMQALARMWRALSTAGTDQAYIVVDTHRLVPGHRKRVEPLPGAEDLFGWPAHPGLRRSNNLVIFLTPERDAVRAELADAAACIHVDVAPLEPIEQVVAMQHLEEDVPSVVHAEIELIDSDEVAAPPPDPGDLRTDLERALIRALLDHPEDHRPQRVPVMDAVARVVARRRPDLWGPLEFSVADGEVSVTGAGAEQFQQAWRRDIALDAAAGMIVNALKGGFSEQSPPALDDTALTALTKRVGRML